MRTSWQSASRSFAGRCRPYPKSGVEVASVIRALETSWVGGPDHVSWPRSSARLSETQYRPQSKLAAPAPALSERFRSPPTDFPVQVVSADPTCYETEAEKVSKRASSVARYCL